MQTLIVFAIVAGAALFVGMRVLKAVRVARTKDAGCAGGCCSADGAAGSHR